METSFPVSRATFDIPVRASKRLNFTLRAQDIGMAITNQMRFGVNPIPRRNKTAASATLVALPGYCANNNPWSRSSSDFTDARYPVVSGNFGNDAYAQRIMGHISDLDSFSFVGHSQGGMVGLHLFNFYFSTLDHATGARLIQSVGTPWQGSTAAGGAADLGDIFGIGCGSNSDLSRDGAVVWLAGISMEARAHVYYYTTTYVQGSFFGDYCSLPMNLILQWPNDGVTELVYARLVGGHNMGNKEKWCHTTNMGYPAQYDDNARNREMNAAAAR